MAAFLRHTRTQQNAPTHGAGGLQVANDPTTTIRPTNPQTMMMQAQAQQQQQAPSGMMVQSQSQPQQQQQQMHPLMGGGSVTGNAGQQFSRAPGGMQQGPGMVLTLQQQQQVQVRGLFYGGQNVGQSVGVNSNGQMQQQQQTGQPQFHMVQQPQQQQQRQQNPYLNNQNQGQHLCLYVCVHTSFCAKTVSKI